MSLSECFDDRQLEFVGLLCKYDNPDLDVDVNDYLRICLLKFIADQANNREFLENMALSVDFDLHSFDGVFPDFDDC